MTAPLSPSDLKHALKNIPDAVFTVVNRLLLEKKSTTVRKQSIVINLEEVVQLLEFAGFSHKQIYDEGMLDFEDHYRQSGWYVVFDKPAYYENHKTHWRFEEQ